jgi:hypothetical protein
MTRSLITPLIWVFLSLPASAGSVEFAQWVPWKFVSQELRKNELLLNLNQREITLSLGELQPKLEGVAFSSRTMVSEFAHSQGSLSLSAHGSMRLELASFRIDQIISREFGGNVLQIHLKADCSPASIEVSAYEIRSLFHLNPQGSFLPELTDLSLDIYPADWKVSEIVCHGAGGVGAEIQKSIREAMRDPASLSRMVKAWMKPYLDEWIKVQWPTINNREGEWNNLRIASAGESGFYLKGELPLTGEDDIALENLLPAQPQLEAPRFYISREGWLALAEDKARKLLPRIYDLRQNQSFRKLQQSRFMQFLVWPHLRNFHSSTPFVLKTDPSSLNFAMTGSKGQWRADVTGNGTLTTLVGGSPIDYIVFAMKISFPFSMRVEDGNLVIQSGKASAALDWKFGYLYELLYSPDKKVPIQMISGSLADLVSGKKESVKLPSFQIADSEYLLGNLRVEDQLLTMDWL